MLRHLTLLLLAAAGAHAVLEVKGAYQPSAPFDVRVWPNYTSPGFVFPELADDEWGLSELQEKPGIGVAFGGGGFRAAIMALGWARGLQEAGLLGKMRYITSCSGASWFNLPFFFTNESASAFLGPYKPPEQLAVHNLTNLDAAGSFGRAVARASFVLAGAMAQPWWVRPQMTWWDEVVGSEFLRPYGLNSKASFFTARGTKGGVDRRVTQLLGDKIPVYLGGGEGRPYPIMTATIMRQEDPHQFFPFEVTPLYVGTPSLHTTPGLPAVGGGYVEPLGFNSKPPAERPQPGYQAVSAKPDWLVPLQSWGGVASGWMSQDSKPKGAVLQTLLSQNKYSYWNLWDYEGGATKFVDGGAVDLNALMPLLRRGVENIVFCIPVWKGMEGLTREQWSRAQFDISALFGVVQPSTNRTIHVDDKLYPKMMQVFPSDQWPVFYQRYHEIYTAAKTPLLQMKLQVLPNAFHGIRGGYEANVLFLLNGRDAGWEARLPRKTQTYLNLTRQLPGHPLGSFPLTWTFRGDAPAELVTMLGQYSTHQMLAAAPLIRDMIGGSSSSSSSSSSSA